MMECMLTLDSLHLWHARSALRLLLAVSLFTNDRTPCMSLDGLEHCVSLLRPLEHKVMLIRER